MAVLYKGAAPTPEVWLCVKGELHLHYHSSANDLGHKASVCPASCVCSQRGPYALCHFREGTTSSAATRTRLVARLLVGRHRQGPRASLEEVRDATGLLVPSAVYVSCSSTYTRSVVVGIGGSTDNNIWSTGSERVKKCELLRCAISYFAETVPWLNFTV